MDESIVLRNDLELRGALAAAPQFSHMSRGERFFVFPVETRRLSGAADRINVIARQSLLESAVLPDESGGIYVRGELRSFNNRRGEGARLVITAFARELRFDQGFKVGEIADVLGVSRFAVNRRLNRALAELRRGLEGKDEA